MVNMLLLTEKYGEHGTFIYTYRIWQVNYVYSSHTIGVVLVEIDVFIEEYQGINLHIIYLRLI